MSGSPPERVRNRR